ncbi:MAG: DUF3093 domain-containing protein [Ruaniaceae bacterium]|nr:DUF3093 domain-containing protein [Ruaniaceae bacterium]
MTYRETLRPPALYIATFCALAASFSLIAVPASRPLAAVIALVLAGAVIITLLATSPRIEVEGSLLRAGRAHIDAAYLGEVTALSKDEMRVAFGRDADARAWSLYRSHARACLRVEIVDPRDPAPYWLICTNDPEALAHAIVSAKNHAAHSEQTGSPFSS